MPDLPTFGGMDTQINGEWWEIDRPDIRVPGTLKFDGKSPVELEIHGTYGLFQERRIPTLFGESYGGVKISLFGCQLESTTMRAELNASKIHVTTGIVGGHFADESNLKTRNVAVRLTHLYEWSGYSWQQIILDQETNLISVKQHQQFPVKLGSLNGITYTMVFGHKFRPTKGDLLLSEHCRVELTSETELNLSEWDDQILRLQHFVALGYGEGVYPSELSLKKPSNDRDGRRNETWKILRYYEGDEEGPKLGRKHSHECLFILSDLKPSPEPFWTAFLNRFRHLRPLTESYLSVVYSKTVFPVQTFLSLAAAVEGHHRATVGGKGQFTLQQRVEAVCQKVEPVTRSLFPEPNEFALIAKTFRNKLTHLGNEKEFSYEEIHLIQLVEAFRLLVELCILREIGFSEAMLMEATEDNSHAGFLRRVPFKDSKTGELKAEWKRYIGSVT